jgi:glycolate oxidase FAD binding subunit
MSRAEVAQDLMTLCASVRAAAPGVPVQVDNLERCTIDGVMPRAVVATASAQEVQAVLAAAHAGGISVVPWGAGQHTALANSPRQYDLAMSLAGMDHIVAYEPADLTVTVEPGVRLANLQQRLAEHGQFLPLDPAGCELATLGGVLASNASGPLRHAYGTARDWVLGVRVVHAGGGVSKSGGRVVKNVAGYDMHKLHIGAHGTLGVVVEATFKVAPLPSARRTLVAACPSADVAVAMALASWDAGLQLRRLELLSPGVAAASDSSAWVVLAEAVGGDGAVERSERALRSIADCHGASTASADDAVWRRWHAAVGPCELSLRATVLPSEVADVVRRVGSSTTATVKLSATVAAGVVRARFGRIDDGAAVALVERLRRELPAGGSLAIESASPGVKSAIDVFGPTRDDFEIMRRLKEQFDPSGVLSPGRFLGRL